MSFQLNQNQRLGKRLPSVKCKKQSIDGSEKRGTVAGAVALIVGTSVGSGILALPQRASPAGALPSSVAMVVFWGFLLIEALLLVEINVALRKKRKQSAKDDELEILSIGSMAYETLGEWGGALASTAFIFLGYSSMIAYSDKSGEILHHLFNAPIALSTFIFIIVFTSLLSFGGAFAADKVNQWLTALMIVLLLAIELLVVEHKGWPSLAGNSNWGEVPTTFPVLVFSLTYHDIIPVLCAYLEDDLGKLRTSVVLGSLVPLMMMLVWNAIALGLPSEGTDYIDPIDLLMSVKWSGLSYIIEAFSLLAVGTSVIGTLLGFSEFYKEQLKNISWTLNPFPDMPKILSNSYWSSDWWERNKQGVIAIGLVITPTLLVSLNIPDSFFAATDIAGGYCMTTLYGILPPAMAWALEKKKLEENQVREENNVKPLLLGVGVCSCCVIMNQLILDLSGSLHL